jgi:hypothetical protein
VNTMCDPLPGRSARPSRRRRFITSRPVHPKLTDVAPQQGGWLAQELPPATPMRSIAATNFSHPGMLVYPTDAPPRVLTDEVYIPRLDPMAAMRI